MSFLSSLGNAIKTGAVLAARFEGIIPNSLQNIPALQKIEDDISQVANIIVSVESIGQTLGLPGAEKLKAAGPLVSQVILKSSILTGHQIENQSLFTQGCTKVADGFADILNSLKAKA